LDKSEAINWLGVNKYAAHRGVKSGSVSKAIKNGVISAAVRQYPSGKKLINQEYADRLWSKYMPINRNALSKQGDNSPGDSGDDDQGPSFIKIRTAKEGFAVKLAQLNYEEKSGLLCRVADVQAAATEMGANFREAVLNIPDKLSPLLAAEKDIDKIYELLTSELHLALDNLSKGKFKAVIE
jgi:hypothetical protein